MKKQPWHKGFKRKTFEEANEARSKFQKAKSSHREQKDEWNAEWKKDHAHLKFCWSCGSRGEPGNPITMAHAQKQRFIRTREDSRRAAWLCWQEHKALDEAQGVDTHQRMADFIDALIKKMKSPVD